MQLSVVIPTIGRATLVEVLTALFLSNRGSDSGEVLPEKIEILVVVDGETSNGVLKKIKNELEQTFESQIKQGRLKLLATGFKAYAAGARNLGIKESKGDIIAFIGDDTIPDRNWIGRLQKWHVDHPGIKAALLGRVAWVDKLASDPFHFWLEQKGLFDYARLNKGLTPDWRHFYTSNISFKKSLLGSDKFSEEFSGWGFEDSELGYRLEQKGMQLSYDSELIVKHDDPQTLEGLVVRTQQAHKNALVFETLHSEITLRPKGFKRLVLRLTLIMLIPLQFIPKIRWWRVWKKAWLEG